MYTRILAALTLLLTFTSTLAQTNAPQCLEYSRIANLSTIGANSSYRSIFLASSSVGSMYDAKMFSAAIAALPALTANQQLNSQCGNLTTVAVTEAATNLTKGVVAQFTGVKPGTIRAGPELLAIVGVVLVVFLGTWSFMP